MLTLLSILYLFPQQKSVQLFTFLPLTCCENNMKKQTGFTLIELVVVIVILGILAVTAAPRFLNLQNDAREARLEGMNGAIESALGIGYGKMAIAGLESDAYVANFDNEFTKADLPFDGCNIGSNKRCVFLYGYPDADETALGLLVVELENQHGSSDWKIETFEKDRLVAVMARDDKTASKEKCSIIYGPPMRENETYTLRINPCT